MYDVIYDTDTVYVSGTTATAEMDFRCNKIRLCHAVGDEGEERFVGTGPWIVPRDFTKFFQLAALMADGRVEM